MVRTYYGHPTDWTIFFFLDTADGAPLNTWPITSGYRVAIDGPQPPPVAGQHGGYIVDNAGHWVWYHAQLTYDLPLILEFNDLLATKVVKYDDDWGVRQVFNPALMGAPTNTQMNTADANTLAAAKTYTDTTVASAVAAALAAYDAKRPSVIVVTDANGNFTYDYTSKGYTAIPVVTYGLEATGGFTINITAHTTTSITGTVKQPKSAVLGLLPFEAAGANLKVNLHVRPA